MASSSTLFAPQTTFAEDKKKMPWDHGRLVVDSTGRNLVHQDGHPFFWNGDSCWELIHRSTREEVDQYLSDRAAKRFNVIQPVAVAEFGAFDTPSRYGHLAFDASSVFPKGDMGRPRVRPGDNDDYWDHVDYVIDRAAEHGIYVCLVVTWASYISPAYAVDESNAYVFGEFIGRRYKDRPNVIYMLGCDRDAEVAGVDYRKVWRLMAEGIKDHDPDHLMSFLTKYFDARHWFEGEKWLDFNMIQYRVPKENWDIHNLVSTAYAKQPPMPAINVECNLEGDCNADVCRREFYWYVFSGAFGHTYGHLSLITWWDNSRPFWTWFNRPTIDWNQALQSQGAEEKLYARNLIESRPLIGRVPDATLIAHGQTEFVDHLEACRGDGYAFIFTPTGKPFAVNMGKISGDQVQAWWFDPRSGKAIEIGILPNRGSYTFKAPGAVGMGNDWILILDDASRRFAAPGTKDFAQETHLKAEKAKPILMRAAERLDANAEAWKLNQAELAPQQGVRGGTAVRINSPLWASAEQRVAAVGKQRYQLAAQVCTQGRAGSYAVTAIFNDANGRELSRRTLTGSAEGTSPYQRYVVEAITPEGTRSADIRLSAEPDGSGAVMFDDVTFDVLR